MSLPQTVYTDTSTNKSIMFNLFTNSPGSHKVNKFCEEFKVLSLHSVTLSRTEPIQTLSSQTQIKGHHKFRTCLVTFTLI